VDPDRHNFGHFDNLDPHPHQFADDHSKFMKYEPILASVVDPYSFFPDPDPDSEFDVGDQYGSGFRIQIRIQYGSRAFMTKN
jgi:hypothetical protein